MKKRYFTLCCATAFLTTLGFIGCSSGDDSPTDTGGSGTGSGNTTHVVPSDPDSGKNNNSEPDNIPSDNTGSGNTGSGNTGSGNTGSGDSGSGNTGSGNTGSGDSGSGSTGSGSTGSGNTGSGDSGSGNTGSGNTGSGSSSSPWKLAFEDNFGDASDTEETNPNPEYWSLAQKGTDTWNRHMSESYDQAFQKGGYLYLYGEEVDGEYKTGGIESRNKFDFQYGQVKCRARFLRQPQGNHTGIWMMPQKEQYGAWPRSGEIDIMEHLDDQDVFWSTVHYYNDTAGEDAKSDKDIKIDNNEFNIYGVIWTKESVSFTLNGEVVFSYKNDQPDSDQFSYQYPFVAPFYLILSQSLGGKGTWEGVIDNSELPAIFQIDWIKVWEYTGD